MNEEYKKWIRHLLVSISVMFGIAIICIPFGLNEFYLPIRILRVFLIIDFMYFIISLFCVFAYKKKKLGNKVNNNSYKFNDDKTFELNLNKKKILFKSTSNKLYDEASKFYGKNYIKNRSKIDVVDEYLEQDK